ncbi:hypothetical protein F5887DRAFT_1076054 [Amanita rubescens]|nr:hypothetical protein F5887DRAFT_1076054 [Amanita rubescens]
MGICWKTATSKSDFAGNFRKSLDFFHDESCFTANEYKAKAWLAAGQTILQKKGRGRLIHVSEFINPITGHLAVRDKGGNITDEARKIIYPGSGGDPWWDTNQLLEQVKHAVSVFE